MELKKIFESIKSDIFTDEIKQEISTLFEASVKEMVNAKVKELEESHKKEKEEAMQVVEANLSNLIIKCIDYAVEEYIKENQIEIESNIKCESYDSIIEGLKNILSNNFISIDEKKGIEKFESKITDLTLDNDKLVKENADLHATIKKMKADEVFESITKDMTDVQKSKMSELVSDLDISDVKVFESKVKILADSIVGESTKVEESQTDDKFKKETEKINEEDSGFNLF